MQQQQVNFTCVLFCRLGKFNPIGLFEDYVTVSRTLDFTGNLFARVSLQITDDFTVENLREEYFTVVLYTNPGLPASIRPDTQPVNITIVDDDCQLTSDNVFVVMLIFLILY